MLNDLSELSAVPDATALRTRTIRDGGDDVREDFSDEFKAVVLDWQLLAEFIMMLAATAFSEHNAGHVYMELTNLEPLENPVSPEDILFDH